MRRLVDSHGEISEFCSLIYCLGIPHHDDLGQISADPHDWKYNIYRVSEKIVDQFAKALSVLEEEGLLQVSKCGKVYRYVNFENHQTLKKDRTPQNDFPGIQWKPLESNGNVREVKGSKEKLSKDKNKTVGDDEKGKSKNEPFEKDFLLIWPTYPRNDEKTNAFKAYRTRRREGIPHNKLAQAVKNYAKHVKDKEKRYIKMGKTFFGPNKVWQDYLTKLPDATNESNLENKKILFFDCLDHGLETDNPKFSLTKERYDDLWDKLEEVKTFDQLEAWREEYANKEK